MVEWKTVGIFGAKTLFGFVLGIGINRGLTYITNKWREKNGLPPVGPNNNSVPALESSGIVIGILQHNSPIAPILIGLSSGKIFDEYYPIVKGILSSDEPPKINEGTPPDNWDVHEIEIKPGNIFLHSKEYQIDQLSKILSSLVTEKTYNRKINQWIPAGYKHPLVIYWAKKIVQDANVRGDDTIAVANAITTWVRQHVPYSFDPQSPRMDEDYFWHPARILETLDSNTGKTLPFDCDCHSILTASMLMSLGYIPVFMLFAQAQPNFYNHIITSVVLSPKYLTVPTYPYYPLETTAPLKPLDYMPKYLNRITLEIVPGTVKNRYG